MTRFVAASNQYLFTATPKVTGYPFTIGFWYAPQTTTLFRELVVLSEITGANDFQIYADTTTAGFAVNTPTSGYLSIDLTSALVAKQWSYYLVRGISTTNRRLSVLRSDGTSFHGQDTTSAAPIPLQYISIGGYATDLSGSADPADGDLAEFFVMDTDAVRGNGQVPREMLWQFAYRGPFSFPHLRKNIVDYQSLREQRGTNENRGRKSFVSPRGYTTWSAVNNPQRSQHAPLMHGTSYPFQRRSVGMMPI